MNTSQVPELPHGCGSWIVTAPDGRVFELYERANVRKAAAAGWRIETAVDYLVRINRMRVEADARQARECWADSTPQQRRPAHPS